MKKKLLTITLALISLLIFWPTTLVSAAGEPSATLYLSPVAATVGPGTSFSAELRVNIKNDSANVVQAALNYPADKMEVTSIDTSSPFSISPEPDTYGEGSMSITRAALPAVGGDQLVVTINFQIKNSLGTAVVGLDQSNSAVISSSSNTNILASVENGTYTIAQPSVPQSGSISPQSTGSQSTLGQNQPLTKISPPNQKPGSAKPENNNSAVKGTQNNNNEQNSSSNQAEVAKKSRDRILILSTVPLLIIGALVSRFVNRKYGVSRRIIHHIRRRRLRTTHHRHETVADIAARLNKSHPFAEETVAEIAARINRSHIDTGNETVAELAARLRRSVKKKTAHHPHHAAYHPISHGTLHHHKH